MAAKWMKDVGRLLLQAREERGLTREELAKKIKITPKAVAKAEAGECYFDDMTLVPLVEKALKINFTKVVAASAQM